MATRRTADPDLRPNAKVVPLPGLGATHTELVREAAATRWTKVHGHDVAYRQAGEGPLLVMIHGIAGSSGTWVPVMPLLAERYTVIAPDLLGHGESAKPRGDYSLGAYASGVRDLLGVLGHERATVVGHSLGGGVAMQFAYQFPQMAERLVLVCSGGLGKEVTPLLRALTVPGTEFVLPVVLRHELHDVLGVAGRVLGRLGLRADPFLGEVWQRVGAPHRRAGPAGLHPHDPRRHRHRRPAGQRPRPPLPRPRGAHDDHLGRPRPGDPGRATPTSPTS